MKPRTIGFVSLIETALVTLWLVLLIVGTANEGAITTFEQRLAQVAELDALFYATYLNAALLTVGAIMLFAGLHVLYKSTAPVRSTMAVMFVPVYGVLNLLVYLAQITIVPQFLAICRQGEYRATCNLLLRQMVQQWPESTVLTINILAYAILGIPSIIYGALLLTGSRLRQVAGGLLALNGIIAILGFAGVVLQNRTVAFAGAVGSGALFLLALFPLTWSLLRE